MRSIAEIDYVFKEYTEKLKKRIVEGQQEIAQELKDDIVSRIEVPAEATRNPQQFEEYINSIQVGETEVNGNVISTEVFSDLVVVGDPKWNGVPIGAFLEWGTGPLGESTNTYQHGYPYTTEEPWDIYTAMQYIETGTWGIKARPHFYPGLMAIKPKYKEMILEAIKNG